MTQPTVEITVVVGGPAIAIQAAGAQGPAGPDGANGAPGVVQSVNGHSTADVELTAADVAAVPLAGGTMTGPLTLSGDPTQSAQAATKNYVDTHGAGGGGVQLGGDLGGTNIAPTVISTHLAAPLPLAQGGTAAADAAGARGALGLGTAATQNTGAFDPAGAASAALSAAESNAAATYIPLAAGAVANGVATLDGSGHLTGVQAANLIPASTATAKGDLLAATGPGAVTRLPAGADGQVLAAAAGQSTGLQWAPLPGSLPPNGAAGGDLTGSYPNPTLTGTANVEGIIRANRLDQFAAPAAAVSMNGQKLTSLGDGANPTDAAAFGQIPAALPPNGAASGDLGGTYPAPTVTGTHLASPLPLAQGGTGQATQQAALNALAGAHTAGLVLRGDGTNVTLAAIQAPDVPTLNQNTTGTAANVSGTVAIGNGGTGQTGRQAAINALTGTQSASTYLRSDGANATLAAIQAADVPTLNQNTSGTAAGLSATLAIASGGTGATSAAAALASLGAVATTWTDMLGLVALTAPVIDSGFTVLQTAGNMVCCLTTPPKTGTVTKLGIWVTAAAVTSSGVNGLALYSEAGTLIDQTGDLSTAFTATAPQWAEGTLGGTQTLTAGTNYYLCVLTHYSGTEPRFAASGTAASGNIPALNGHYPALFKTAQASFPSSFTPSSFSLNSGVYVIYAR